MKVKVLVAVLMLAFIQGRAQKSRVQDASNYMKYEEWDKAKEAIDDAANNETSKAMEKMWYYRGKIYATLFENAKFPNLCGDNCLEVAYESFKKSIELNPKSEWVDEINSYWLPTIPGLLFKQASKNYEAKNYEAALAGWQRSAKLSPSDTGEVYKLSTTYSAYAAERANKKDVAAEIYETVIKKKFADDNVYNSLATIYSGMKKNDDAIRVIEAGRAQFPDSLSLIYTQINLYLSSGKQKEATDVMNAAIAKDPNNQSLYLAMGSVFDNMANPKDAEGKDLPKPANYQELMSKSVDAYKKGLAVNPDNYEINYNLGALIFNDAAEIINAANKINDNKKYELEKQRADSKFKEALPYLEKAMEKNPRKSSEDESLFKGTLISLKQLYAKIGDNEKYDKIKAMLDAK